MRQFNPERETEKIVTFLKTTLSSVGKTKVVINWSGGIDSTVSLYLLAKAFPITNVTILHLPYETSYEDEFLPIADYLQTTKAQFHVVSIQSMVDEVKASLKISDPFRVGNVMSRIRMVVAFDNAKKLGGLVCGTENRTEDLLGYFTRFGDEASDIEPIQHLYKTEVFELGKFLGVPNNILDAQPTAGLWAGQTDEGEFGFSYEQADNVLSRYYDEKKTIEEIEKEGFLHAKKVIEFAQKNGFKHKTPYTI
jgi:NAD+ synthase